jgi:hypothetical protein
MTTLTTLEKARLVDALCRTDLVSFVHKVFNTLLPNRRLEMNFHIQAMAFELELAVGVMPLCCAHGLLAADVGQRADHE